MWIYLKIQDEPLLPNIYKFWSMKYRFHIMILLIFKIRVAFQIRNLIQSAGPCLLSKQKLWIIFTKIISCEKGLAYICQSYSILQRCQCISKSVCNVRILYILYVHYNVYKLKRLTQYWIFLFLNFLLRTNSFLYTNIKEVYG